MKKRLVQNGNEERTTPLTPTPNFENLGDTPILASNLQQKKENVNKDARRIFRQPLHQAGYRNRHRSSDLATHLPGPQLGQQHRQDHRDTDNNRQLGSTVLLPSSGTIGSQRRIPPSAIGHESSLTNANKSPTWKGMRAKTFFALLILGTVISAAGVGYAIGIGSFSTSKPATVGINITATKFSFNTITVLWGANGIFVDALDTVTPAETYTASLTITLIDPASTNPNHIVGTNAYSVNFSPATSGVTCAGTPVTCEDQVGAYTVTASLSNLSAGSTITVSMS